MGCITISHDSDLKNYRRMSALELARKMGLYGLQQGSVTMDRHVILCHAQRQGHAPNNCFAIITSYSYLFTRNALGQAIQKHVICTRSTKQGIAAREWRGITYLEGCFFEQNRTWCTIRGGFCFKSSFAWNVGHDLHYGELKNDICSNFQSRKRRKNT
jgi:hypothetical protein